MKDLSARGITNIFPEREGMNQRFLERKLTMWTTMTAATVQQECARRTCTTYSPAHATLRTQTFTGAGAAQFVAHPVLRNCTRTRCSTQQPSEAFATQGATWRVQILLQVETRVRPQSNVRWNHRGSPQYNFKKVGLGDLFFHDLLS